MGDGLKKFDLENAVAVIAGYPDMRAPVPLTAWLLSVLKDPRRIAIHRYGHTDIVQAYNMSVRIALASPYGHFIFCDNDVTPQATAAFLDADEDVVSMMCETSTPSAFAERDAFHTMLWRTRRDVLESLEKPVFRPFRYSEDGADRLDCLCSQLKDRLQEKGWTTGHAGWADHPFYEPKAPMVINARGDLMQGDGNGV